MTSGGDSDRTHLIRREPDTALTPTTAVDAADAPATSIIRRHPTGSFPVLPEPPADDIATSYLPRAIPVEVGPPPRPSRPSPSAAIATSTVSILSGWATAVIATSLIASWWRTDELFCVAIGFLTAVSAAASIGGLISLLLRRRIGRVLTVVGAVVAIMIFAGLFVAGAALPPVVYAIPLLPIASVVLAVLPATGRWCR